LAPSHQASADENGTKGRQGAVIGTESPENVPNDVLSTFPRLISQWERNKREVIRVELDQYNGRHTVNVRVWYRDGDALKPTRTGLTLSVKHLAPLATALSLALEAAQESGLLDGGAQ
jgi:hypothetical protein